MERLSAQLRGARASRDKNYQDKANLQRKKAALVQAGCWDLRTSAISLLTKEERKIVCISRALERIKEGGKYSDLSLNYGPKILQDWGVSANNFRPLMKDAFA